MPPGFPTGSSGLSQLGQTVSELANDLRERADRLGRTDLSQRINAEAARWPDANCAVAIVGGRGAGTSRLVAALTGRSDLGSDRPTAVPTIVRQSLTERSVVCDIDGQLREYRQVDAAFEPARTEFVELYVDAPRLIDGLTLVDTPEVGSPTDPRGNRAYLATRRADHLLVVVDLGAPLSRPDVAFVERCADRFAAITVVGTRIDRIRGWQHVLDDSVAAIIDRLPDLDVSAFGVAPNLAEAAFDPELGDDESMELLTDSGIGGLQAHLDAIVTRRRHLRLANFSSLLESVAAELATEGRSVVEASHGEIADDVNDLASLRSQLTRVRDDRTTWLAILSDAIVAARDETGTDVIRTLNGLHATYTARIDEWKGDGDELLGQFDDDLRTEAAACATRIADRIEHVVQIVSTSAAAVELGLHVDADLIAEQLASIEGPEPAATTGRESGNLKLRATGGLVGMASSSTMMLTALGGSGGAAALMRVGALGAAALFSGVSAAVAVAGGRRQRDRQQLRAIVKSRVDAIRSEHQGVLRRYFVGVQRQIEATLKDLVRDRIAVLEREISELQTTARADAVDRKRRATTLEAELRQVADLQRRSRELASRLAGGTLS
jgi:hypothetical protein